MPDAATLIPVEEYLHTTYKPGCEYEDGVLTPKPISTWKHSLIQSRCGQLLLNSYPAFLPGSELTVQLREGRYLVPDIAVQRKDRLQDPYPSEPIHLCIEILSPDDRLSELMAKAEEYHAWGVHMVWILDPEKRIAWQYSSDRRFHEIPAGGSLTADPISIAVDDIYSVL